jgi:hypothetical protein
MKTTTDATHWRFFFTITDAARFLGKSPVTLRGWERQGLVTLPREIEGGDRKFTQIEICGLAYRAFELKRISRQRLHLVIAATELIHQVEQANL